MKVLILGLDSSVLDKTSKLTSRIVGLSKLVEELHIITPNKKNKKTILSPKATAHGIKTSNKIIGIFRIYKYANKLIAKNDIHLISAQDQYFLALVAYLLARRYKLGLEIQVHGFEKYFGIRKIIAQYILPRANAVRCVSLRLQDQLIKDFGVSKEKITTIPITPPIISEKKIVNKASDPFIFLAVSRLVPVKNIPLLIEAFKDVCKKEKALLWLVGDGPERRKIEELIRREKLEKRVIMHGWQDNLEKYYEKSDAFVLASNKEGWGMVIVEAAAHGLPIVMTDVGCAHEFVHHDKSALISPVGDMQTFAANMQSVLSNKNLRQKLAKSAQIAYNKLPGQSESLKKYKASWQKIIDNHDQ